MIGLKTSEAGRDTGDQSLSILLLCDNHPAHASTILEHVDGLVKHSVHRVYTFNPLGVHRSRALDLGQFDVVVIHYSLMILSDHYLAPWFRERIRRFPGLKIQFIQDDYRRVDEMRAAMRNLGIHVLFTLVPEREIPAVWPESELPAVTKINALPGYVGDDAPNLRTPDPADRPLDVVYRGREVPYWLGILAQEKAWIGQGFLERAKRYGLRCDIGWREADRIYGLSWIQFMSSGRATLGSESGTTITDFDGTLERSVTRYLRDHPGAGFWEVHNALLAHHERNVMMNIVSPRVFEAIALRTALVLFPGEYSGVIRPNDHYIPLAKDFSNMEQVAELIRDVDYLRALTERTHDDVIASGRYSLRTFVRQFDRVVSDHHDRLGSASRTRTTVTRGRFDPVERTLRHRLAVAERTARVRGPSAMAIAFSTSLALALSISEPSVRRLLWRWWSEVRNEGEISRAEVVQDVLRLCALWRAARGRSMAGSDVRIESGFSPDTATLWYRGRVGSARDESRPAGERRPFLFGDVGWNGQTPVKVRWDHADPGGVVTVRPLGLPLRIIVGDDGTYEFQALPSLLSRLPDATRAALPPPGRLPVQPRYGARRARVQ